MLSFLPKNKNEIKEDLKQRLIKRRKSLKITQKELSDRSDVSFGSIKRFESSGEISFSSLLKVALVLECLEDFEKVCVSEDNRFESIEEVLK